MATEITKNCCFRPLRPHNIRMILTPSESSVFGLHFAADNMSLFFQI